MQAKKKAAPARKKTVVKKRAQSLSFDANPYSPLSFSEIQERANVLADRIESRFEDLAHILLEYESYEVVLDETERTLDLLRNLKENESFFRLRIGAVAAFLPRNQPLYAFTCFVLIPSFMANEVHFRIPHSMKHFFPKLLALLEIYDQYPNVVVSHSQRTEFIRERTALRVNPKTKETWPVTEAVIFTGTPIHADQLRMAFDQRTLFITNGSGHNPVVVSVDADIREAVEAVLTLQLYNQGQDCAAPNTVLVHKDIFHDFLRTLRDEIRAVRVGDYRDRRCRVGPISDPKDLVRVQDLLIDNRDWLDPTTPGIIRAYDAILEPTIITKPLKEGGNYGEIFAPVIFLQMYEKDEALAQYFEDPRYAQNAMYLTLYGTSAFVRNFVGQSVEGKILHEKRSFLHNKHLHAAGAERGTEPYGGNGYGASNLSINGKITPKATLPQRDIYELVAKPLLAKGALQKRTLAIKGMTEIVYKDVQKLMRMKAQESEQEMTFITEATYIDLEGLQDHKERFVRLEEERIHRLLESPNAKYVATLPLGELEQIRALRKMLPKPSALSTTDFATAVYALAADSKASKTENRKKQLRFFQNIYQLLLGKESGPRLAQFLCEIDHEKACALLDV